MELDALLHNLKRHEIVSRIPDARTFASANLIVLATHKPSGVALDISLGWTGFEREALAEQSKVTFGSLRLPVASAEDLVVFKIVAARPVDLDDAKALIALYPNIDRARVRARVRELTELMDEPERLAVLEQLLREIAPSPKQPRPRHVTPTTRKTSKGKKRAANPKRR